MSHISQFVYLFILTGITLIVFTSSISRFEPSTKSNWSSFTCFSQSELGELFDDEYLSQLFQMGQGIDLLFDDWGLSSLSAAIILREMMGYNISLSSYTYSNTMNIIINSSYIASSLEIYPNYLNPLDIYHYSVENQLFIDQQLGVQSFTSWYIANSFIEHINKINKLQSNSNEIWLDFWKTYTSQQITDELLKANQLQSFNITHSEEYLWNPTTKCDGSNSCNVLLIRDRNYDLRLNEMIIREHNLSFSIKYLDKQDRNLFIDEFVLYSLSEPSSMVSSNQFTRISLPSQYQLSQVTLIHKFIPHILDIVSSFAFQFLQSLKMNNNDYAMIYESIINDIGIDMVLMEDRNIRLKHVCNWLKSRDIDKIWMSWIPDIKQYSADSINCGLYSDTELSHLRYLNDYMYDIDNKSDVFHINSTEIARDLYYNKLEFSEQSSFPDLWTAIRVNKKCVSPAPNYPNSLLAIQIISLILIFFIIICFILVFLSRHEVIIIAASYPLLLSFLFGALLGCLVPIFGYPSSIYYIFEILCVHTCIILMFGSLIGKSWRLHVIIVNAKKGRSTDITTQYILHRICILCCIMYLYWLIVAVWFAKIAEIYDIVDGIEYLRVSMDNDRLFTSILLIFEFIFILWGARLAWSLRAVNPQFNESKHIAVILYHTFFVILLIGIFFILSINPHTLRALWMSVWLLMVTFTVSILMIPKFRAIWQGVEYIDKGLVDRRRASMAVSSNSNWIPKELKTEQIQELATVLRKLGFKVHRKSPHSSIGSSSNILKMRKKTRSIHSASVDEYDVHIMSKQRLSPKSTHSTLSPQTLSPHTLSINNNNNNKLPTISSNSLINILHSSSQESHISNNSVDNIDNAAMIKLNKIQSSPHFKSHSVLGLPPPSTWSDDEDDDEQKQDEKKKKENDNNNDGENELDVAIAPKPKQINKINKIKINRVPPPLPSHIKKEFERKGDYKRNINTKIHHQRAGTSPVSLSAVSPLQDIIDIDDEEDDDDNFNHIHNHNHNDNKNNKNNKISSKQSRNEHNRSGVRVTDIIAKFNYINVPVTSPIPDIDDDYID